MLILHLQLVITVQYSKIVNTNTATLYSMCGKYDLEILTREGTKEFMEKLLRPIGVLIVPLKLLSGDWSFATIHWDGKW